MIWPKRLFAQCILKAEAAEPLSFVADAVPASFPSIVVALVARSPNHRASLCPVVEEEWVPLLRLQTSWAQLIAEHLADALQVREQAFRTPGLVVANPAPCHIDSFMFTFLNHVSGTTWHKMHTVFLA
eukprot:TRINITY_DN47237_c0_g1_i1.p2 TRINITY_DN47237_c0_g1~~TRINITY_DN47237_c0_g1_i1.p2  ORF type:complete len:128 (+),score=24.02 TRINITY_DN47237_c0_g1_i1:128-511(+)